MPVNLTQYRGTGGVLVIEISVSVSPLFIKERLIFLSLVKNIDSKLLDYSDLCLSQILLFGDTSLDVNTNSAIYNATIDFIISSK